MSIARVARVADKTAARRRAFQEHDQAVEEDWFKSLNCRVGRSFVSRPLTSRGGNQVPVGGETRIDSGATFVDIFLCVVVDTEHMLDGSARSDPVRHRGESAARSSGSRRTAEASSRQLHLESAELAVVEGL
jgi:hypothetical protein